MAVVSSFTKDRPHNVHCSSCSCMNINYSFDNFGHMVNSYYIISLIEHQESSIAHPASSIHHRASSIQHRASIIEPRASSILHPASSIVYFPKCLFLNPDIIAPIFCICTDTCPYSSLLMYPKSQATSN